MERLKRKVEKLDRAVRKLKEVLSGNPWEVPEEVLVELRVKRFEYAFEALWQAAMAFLRERGLECASPRSCFEGLLREGVVSAEEEETSVRILRMRNTLVHVYDEEEARRLAEEIARGPYASLMEGILRELKKFACKEA